MLLSAVSFVGAESNGKDDVNKQIEKAIKATETYHDVNKAEKDGYELASPYVPGMEFHYVNSKLVDEKVDESKPEALLYVPTEDGLRLVAVEYISVVPNELYDLPFDPPFGDIPYTLHAWIWEENPDGMFTPFNPDIE